MKDEDKYYQIQAWEKFAAVCGILYLGMMLLPSLMRALR